MDLKVSDDVAPITEFRARTAELLEKLRQTGRPLVLTQRGWPAAVLESVEQFERRLERLETLEAVVRGLRAAEAGEVVSHKDAMRQLDELVKD